jgi:hypothetical protein
MVLRYVWLSMTNTLAHWKGNWFFTPLYLSLRDLTCCSDCQESIKSRIAEETLIVHLKNAETGGKTTKPIPGFFFFLRVTKAHTSLSAIFQSCSFQILDHLAKPLATVHWDVGPGIFSEQPGALLKAIQCKGHIFLSHCTSSSPMWSSGATTVHSRVLIVSYADTSVNRFEFVLPRSTDPKEHSRSLVLMKERKQCSRSCYRVLSLLLI